MLTDGALVHYIHCKVKGGELISRSLSGTANPSVLNMTMEPHSKEIFFAERVLFVEGYADEKVIQALQSLLQRDITLLTSKTNVSQPQNILKWSIIPLNGCGNVQPLVVARNLQVPFKVLFDGDVINGSSMSNYIQKVFGDNESSRLNDDIVKACGGKPISTLIVRPGRLPLPPW